MVKLLSSNINIIMSQYIVEPKKTLKKWVESHVEIDNILNFEYVYCRYPNKINKYKLTTCNSIMAKLILKYMPDIINWCLSGDPSMWAYKLLKNNQDKIDWIYLSSNQSQWAYKLLKNNLDKIGWRWLSINPSKWAYKLLKTNLDKINLEYVSSNPSIWAYKLLKNNLGGIDWVLLSENPSHWAYKLLKTNLDEIDWDNFSSSPYLFKIIKTNKYYKLFDSLFHEKLI